MDFLHKVGTCYPLHHWALSFIQDFQLEYEIDDTSIDRKAHQMASKPGIRSQKETPYSSTPAHNHRTTNNAYEPQHPNHPPFFKSPGIPTSLGIDREQKLGISSEEQGERVLGSVVSYVEQRVGLNRDLDSPSILMSTSMFAHCLLDGIDRAPARCSVHQVRCGRGRWYGRSG